MTSFLVVMGAFYCLAVILFNIHIIRKYRKKFKNDHFKILHATIFQQIGDRYYSNLIETHDKDLLDYIKADDRSTPECLAFIAAVTADSLHLPVCPVRIKK